MASLHSAPRHTWQQQQSRLLAREIKEVLSLLEDRGLAGILEEPLSAFRRGLYPENVADVPWHLLPLIICEGLGAAFERALPVAAAMQFMLAAGDVLDDIEDRDNPSSLGSKYGFPISINAATALIVLAEQSLSLLSQRKVDTETILDLYSRFNHYYSLACSGQHLDLSSGRQILSEESYLKLTSLKSAVQIECACRLGAIVATGDKTVINSCASFGQNLGMAAQITNDIMGITEGKDISHRKITLPVIFALNGNDSDTVNTIKHYYLGEARDPIEIGYIKALLQSTGSLYYATVKLELYKQNASRLLACISQTGMDTGRLEQFVK